VEIEGVGKARSSAHALTHEASEKSAGSFGMRGLVAVDSRSRCLQASTASRAAVSDPHAI